MPNFTCKLLKLLQRKHKYSYVKMYLVCPSYEYCLYTAGCIAVNTRLKAY